MLAYSFGSNDPEWADLQLLGLGGEGKPIMVGVPGRAKYSPHGPESKRQ